MSNEQSLSRFFGGCCNNSFFGNGGLMILIILKKNIKMLLKLIWDLKLIL